MANLDNMAMPVSKELKRNWGWLLALGILFEILGFIGMGMVVTLTMVSILFIGVLFIAGGVIQLIDSFKCRGWKAFIWHVLIALLYIIAGGLVIYDPVAASAIITMILAWVLIVIGVTRCVMAFSLKSSSRGWIWLLIAGVAAIVLGIMILMQWPMSSFWIIGLLLAIEMIINGWSYILLALAIKNA